jgi:hypothetical protein
VANRSFGSLAEYQEHWHAEKGGRCSTEEPSTGWARLRLLPRPAEPQSGYRTPAPITQSGALERVRTETQDALITFLEIDLDLSETILKTAEMATSSEHVRMALARVRQSLQVIRRLGSRIKNTAARMRIHNRASGVERRMNSISLLYQASGLQP